MKLPDEFNTLFREATNTVTILGTNPLIPHLENGVDFFRDLLISKENLSLTILVESDSENFSQSLCVDAPAANNRTSYAELNVHRDRILGRGSTDGWLADFRDSLREVPQRESVYSRVKVYQVNLRLPLNAILVDETVWCSLTGVDLPTIESYFRVASDSPLYESLVRLVTSYTNNPYYSKFHSNPGDELIQMFDKLGYPRGIYPRRAFYTTAYQRHSIWGFVFNRNGQLLLHQRSKTTKDGRNLWDKSVGGHVDLRDSSTFMTAQRELVEEMFLPEAEFSKYIQADIGDIVHFGEWNRNKRPERTFREALATLGESDWVLFRATDEDGEPLTITRVSLRRMHDGKNDDDVTFKRTVFRSDVFLFIAPKGLIDDDDSMKKLLGVAEEKGAASDHRLTSIGDLRDWIAQAEEEGTERETFTDDLLYVNLTYRDMLESFASFVTYVSQR